MDINVLTEYMVPTIFGICLCAGYVAKHWLPADNRLIPTGCALLGLALACWMHYPCITAEVVLQGLASGLASTGLHQAFAQMMGGADHE